MKNKMIMEMTLASIQKDNSEKINIIEKDKFRITTEATEVIEVGIGR